MSDTDNRLDGILTELNEIGIYQCCMVLLVFIAIVINTAADIGYAFFAKNIAYR